MGRKPVLQPLTLGESDAYKHAEALGSTAAAAASAAAAAAAAHGRGESPPLNAETAMHGESPLASRSPMSPMSRQSSSPALTSRFARPQTAKGSPQTIRSPSANDLQQIHRPPHLQLHEQRPRDDSVPKHPAPVSSPYHDQTPGSAPPTFRLASPGEARRPATNRGFFHFNKFSSKDSNQLQNPTSPYPESRVPSHAGGPEGSSAPRFGEFPNGQDLPQKPNGPILSRSELSLSSAGDYESPPASSTGRRRHKSKSFGLLSRSRSNRDKDHDNARAAPTPVPATPVRSDSHDHSGPLHTAPVAPDRAFSDMMVSSARNRSADRAPVRDSSREKERGLLPPNSKDNNSSFLSGLRSSSTKAADIISKGLFGKNSRSGSTSDKEAVVDDEHYVLKVMNLPLVEQTRKTRISKRLEFSRDKTEFWMPAFPWRAIDYLNFKGCEVEGLYRVPGSGPQIKKWQRKFDEQYDVNLLDEDGLYDINIIGSMLKAWLRELPDELFPKEAQDRIARECAGNIKEVPQLLVDELSNLPPFNYYLLFAITCHLSLLLAHSEKNKMDYTNLCICFQPCMKIDAFCFKFLVTQWRDCWQGCKNETRYIEEEYRLFDLPPPRGISEPNAPSHSHEVSDGNNVSTFGSEQKPRSRHFPGADSGLDSRSSSISAAVPTSSEREPPEKRRDIHRLSPIKPLSPIAPMGFQELHD